jgi:hypothetical protein
VDRVQRRIAAIVAADVVGYSRLMGEDEETTLATLNGYTSPVNGDVVFVGNSVAGGNPGPGAIVLGTVRLDNQNPQAPTNFTLAPSVNIVPGAQGAFINAGFSFTDSTALTSPLLTFAAGTNGDNGGVDRVFVRYFAGAQGATDVQLTRVRTGADLAPSVSGPLANQTYRLQARLSDALGNSRTIDLQNNLGQNLFFGVDVAAPTVTGTAGSPGGAAGANFAQVAGNGAIGISVTDELSGFGATPVFATMVRLRGTGTAGQVFECVDPYTGANLTALANGTCPTVNGGLAIAVPTIEGYYFLTYFVRDQAGNQSATRTQRFLIDGQAPVLGGVAIPAIINGGQPVNFSSSATDNLDLIDQFTSVDYGNTVQFRYDSPLLGTRYDSVLTRNATVAGAVPFFIRQLEFADANGLIIGGSATKPQTVSVVVGDGVPNYAIQTVPLAAINVQNSPGSLTAQTGITSFRLATTTAFTNIARTGTTQTAVPTTRSLTITVTGPASTFNTPFASVQLYFADPTSPLATANSYRLLGTALQAGLTDVGGTRTITYTFTLTGLDAARFSQAVAAPGFPYAFRAVGVTANGDAVVSNAVTLNVIQ